MAYMDGVEGSKEKAAGIGHIFKFMDNIAGKGNFMLYEKHIFVCVNQRPEGARICCGEEHGLKLVQAFKEEILKRGLKVKVRAQKTGCFDICETGPNVMVYHEGLVSGKVMVSDVPEIMENHIVGGKPVDRLRINF